MITIGKHMIESKDIFDQAVDVMLAGIRAKMFYADPPWGDGSVKYWSTMNRKMTGMEIAPRTFEEFVDRLIELAVMHTDGYVVIENGPRWEDMLMKKMDAAFFGVQNMPLTYSGKDLKSFAVVGSTSRSFPQLPIPISKKGYGLVRELVGSATKAGDTVIDPCCGMGYTAQACVDQGLRFIGNEFNVKRLEKTISRLQKA